MAAAGERSGQPDLHDVECEVFRNHALAEGEDVAVVVFAGQASGFEIPAEGAADAFDFIGDDGFAVSRAAEDDAAVEFAAGDGFGSRANENGIIHRRVAEGTEIADIVTQIVQEDFDFLFVIKASMVGSDGDLHGGKIISRETRVSSSSSPPSATTRGNELDWKLPLERSEKRQAGVQCRLLGSAERNSRPSRVHTTIRRLTCLVALFPCS